jgi:hypothetical protein
MTSLADDTVARRDGAGALVESGEVSASELLEAAIERIEAIDPKLNAVVIRWFDEARATARARCPTGPFEGRAVPAEGSLGGVPGSAAEQRQQGAEGGALPSPADTTLVARFRAAGSSPRADEQPRARQPARRRSRRRGGRRATRGTPTTPPGVEWRLRSGRRLRDGADRARE